jgi:hypothetical protein
MGGKAGISLCKFYNRGADLHKKELAFKLGCQDKEAAPPKNGNRYPRKES